jgi:uncharacterized membrane protein
VLGTNIIGRRLVLTGERLLLSIPLVRSIYTSAKQVLESVAFATEKPFQQVVLVPYPRRETYAIGLVTRKVAPQVSKRLTREGLPSREEEEPKGEPIYSVFVPTTPNFTSGLMLMFPHHEILPLSMSIEDGFKYLMTGGLLTPSQKEIPDEIQQLEEWDLFLH